MAETNSLPPGIMRWLTTTNHQDIGTLYLLFSLLMFFIAGVRPLIIRGELFTPGLQFTDPDRYNQLVTMHGFSMILGIVVPVWIGIMN